MEGGVTADGGEKQIPCGNDNKKGKSKSKSKSKGNGNGFDAKDAKGAKVREGRRRAVRKEGRRMVWFGSMADDGNGKKKSGTLSDLVKAESMIQLALVLPAACVIGALVGSALDKHFHTGWIAVVGILLGAAAGFIQIYRTASRYMKRDH